MIIRGLEITIWYEITTTSSDVYKTTYKSHLMAALTVSRESLNVISKGLRIWISRHHFNGAGSADLDLKEQQSVTQIYFQEPLDKENNKTEKLNHAFFEEVWKLVYNITKQLCTFPCSS